MRRLRFILLFLTVVTAAPAPAAVIRDLDEAQVPVAGQAPAERAAAVRAAFTQVLIKVTGDREIAANPKVGDMLGDAERYVQQYRYRLAPTVPANGTPPAAPAAPEATPPAPQQLLWVHFDGDAITRDLSRLGIPVWGKTRPGILLWLAVDEGDQRYVVAGDKAADLQHSIEQEAAQRGIRVFLPLFDLEDQMALSFADVWGNFQQSIERASQRYRPDAILVGRVYQPTPGVWQGRWTLYAGQTAANWDAAGADTAGAAVAGIDGAADDLAQQYAQVISASATAAVNLEVTGVASAGDYARVMKYLSGLESVSQALVTRVSTDRIDVKLSLLGDTKAFLQRLSLGSTLEQGPPPTPDAAGTPGNDLLVYRLQP